MQGKKRKIAHWRAVQHYAGGEERPAVKRSLRDTANFLLARNYPH